SRSFVDASEGDIEEEKRLFYVAVTRAKQELFLSFYIKKGSNERSVGRICRFLDPVNVGKTFERRAVKPLSRPAYRRSRY
ncbi:MAG: 3'-5' exonuclease, partial [Deltaproteobacteria bacterium]